MWVALSDMKISPIAQRERLNQGRVDRIAREFDPDKFDAPKVNLRDGTHWVVDGWHRTEAAKIALGEDQTVQCWVRRDLSDAEAAEWSLGLNDYRAWSSLDRFRLAVTAGRPMESDIDRVVRLHGLIVGTGEGHVGCPATLIRIYKRGGANVLTRTLTISLGAYGDSGCDQYVLDGIAYVVQRYNGQVDDKNAIARLGAIRGGKNGLLGRAAAAHDKHLGPLAQCVAAAVVDVINAGKGGKKLPSWWKATA